MIIQKIGLIGLGYVGLPLLHAFHAQYKMVGFDISVQRVDELNHGVDVTGELSSSEVRQCLENGVTFTSDSGELKDCNVYIITVPTPIDYKNQPDLSPLINASRTVGQFLELGDLVIYESTVYPGVTEEICVPELEKASSLKFNSDFYCGYSPERINPGDKEHKVTNILKVTSGSTPEIAQIVDDLYSNVIAAGTHMCSSIKIAEASKVVENTQRDMNIALINELAIIFNHVGINTMEVIEAAATKWNFIKYSPGLVGGHCIGVDPYYLTYKAEQLGYTPNLILGARNVNNGMGRYVAQRTLKLMLQKDLPIKNSRILVLGFTFKENCSDIRNSKVVDIVNEMQEFGCEVDIFDDVACRLQVKKEYGINLIESFELDSYKGVIVAVAHDSFKSIQIPLSDERVLFDVKSLYINHDGTL